MPNKRRSPPKPPTGLDIARMIGVSQSTVSLVISDKDEGRVSPETRNRILRLAEELNYHPNATARSLRLGKTFSIALVVANIGHPLFVSVLRGVERAARQKNYTVMLLDTMNDPTWVRWVPDLLTAQSIDGCIVYTGDRLTDREVASLSPNVVLIEGVSGKASSLQMNIRAAAEQAVEHLVGLGHRRIGYLASDLPRESFEVRSQAYRAVLAAHHLPYDPVYTERTSFEVSMAVAAARRLLELPNRPTAIFCDDDLLAAIVYKAAFRMGLRIPADLSVVGFDDLHFARILEPELTTVTLPAERLGHEAMQLMQKRLDHKPLHTKFIRLDMVVRASTAPPNSKF